MLTALCRPPGAQHRLGPSPSFQNQGGMGCCPMAVSLNSVLTLFLLPSLALAFSTAPPQLILRVCQPLLGPWGHCVNSWNLSTQRCPQSLSSINRWPRPGSRLAWASQQTTDRRGRGGRCSVCPHPAPAPALWEEGLVMSLEPSETSSFLPSEPHLLSFSSRSAAPGRGSRPLN